MRKILTSGCLYGWHCRYDAVDCPFENEDYLKWRETGRLVVVCPEVFGGLVTPRPDSQRIGNKVIAETNEDVTNEYNMGAMMALNLARKYDVACCIMKEDSPSCGSNYIYDGTFTDTKIRGEGMAVELLRKCGYKVFSENEIEEAILYLKSIGEY